MQTRKAEKPGRSAQMQESAEGQETGQKEGGKLPVRETEEPRRKPRLQEETGGPQRVFSKKLGKKVRRCAAWSGTRKKKR
jgi:hypothetical protein